MKSNYLISSIVFTVIILTLNQTANGQLPISNSNFTQILEEKYGQKNYYDNSTKTVYDIPATVTVNYESPTTILIRGHFVNSIRGINTFNWQLWQAMDLLRNQYGFHLQSVIPGGEISVGNPTVYILMTK
jgi:hypothetical protein